MTPATTRAPERLHDPVARSVREAAHRTVDRAHRYRPDTYYERLAHYGSRESMLRHIHTFHNHDNQTVPVACLTDKELWRYHSEHLHRFDAE